MAKKHLPNEWWDDNKKLEVVTSYMVLGKASLAEAATGVPAGTIRRWKREPWWNEFVSQIQSEDSQELDSKLSKRLATALDIVDDRLNNGDYILDSKTGTIIRKPVNLRDTWRTAKDMIDVRSVLRKQQHRNVDEEAQHDVLQKLAKAFSDMVKNGDKSSNVVDLKPDPVSGVYDLPAQ